jgi:hypothetical protein
MPWVSMMTFSETRVLLPDSADDYHFGTGSVSVIVPPQSVTDFPILKMTPADYSRMQGAYATKSLESRRAC